MSELSPISQHDIQPNQKQPLKEDKTTAEVTAKQIDSFADLPASATDLQGVKALAELT